MFRSISGFAIQILTRRRAVRRQSSRYRTPIWLLALLAFICSSLGWPQVQGAHSAVANASVPEVFQPYSYPARSIAPAQQSLTAVPFPGAIPSVPPSLRPSTWIAPTIPAGDTAQFPLLVGSTPSTFSSIASKHFAAKPVSKLKTAQTLNREAAQLLANGKARAAITTWQAAQKEYEAQGDQEGSLGTQLNQAQAFQVLGFYQRAHKLLDELQQQLKHHEPTIQAMGYYSLGNILQTTGYLKESETTLQKSLDIAQTAAADSSSIWMAMGNTRRAMGNESGAIKAYEMAIETAPDALSKLEARLNLFSLWMGSQNMASAHDLFLMVQRELDDLPPSRRSVYARINLAATLLGSQSAEASQQPHPLQRRWARPREIAKLLSTAAQQARQFEDKRAESYALGELGNLYEQHHQWTDARQFTQQAIWLAQQAQAPDIAYRWQWQAGRLIVETAAEASQLKGDHPEQSPLSLTQGLSLETRQGAIATYQDAVTTLNKIRANLIATTPELQFSFRESIEPLYRELISLLIQPDSSPEMLEAARNLIEDRQVAELENFFRSACFEVTSQEIDDIDSNAAVIYPFLLPDRLEILVSIAGHPMTHTTVLKPQLEIENILEDWLSSLHPTYSLREQQQEAQKAYGLLFEPIAELLQDETIKTLVFVPEGRLRNMPIAALYDGNHYLIEDYQVIFSPGLQLLEPRQLTSENLEALTVGLSQARQGFAELPGVQKEIKNIQEIVSATVILDEEFTQDNLTETIEASSFPIVHLATHGQFSSDPDETFLLSWDNKINVRNIKSLLKSPQLLQKNPIELLVLSACQTAVGDRHAALGLAGFSVQSGARSTVASLWSVDDDSTALLMTNFYQQLANSKTHSRGESLRQAQLSLINDKNSEYRKPFYWSPFIIIGNWL